MRNVHPLEDAENEASINSVKSFCDVYLDGDSAWAYVPVITMDYFRSKDNVLNQKPSLNEGCLIWEDEGG